MTIRRSASFLLALPLVAFNLSAGSVRVANQAGAAPKIMPVISARTKAKARTISEGAALMGRK